MRSSPLDYNSAVDVGKYVFFQAIAIHCCDNGIVFDAYDQCQVVHQYETFSRTFGASLINRDLKLGQILSPEFDISGLKPLLRVA